MPTTFTNTEKLALFKGTFRGREDAHGTRDPETGRIRSVKRAVDSTSYLNHLCGRQPLGIYPLVRDRVWFGAIDLDRPDPEPVLELNRLGRDLRLPPLIERSKSKGWHLWWFADEEGWRGSDVQRLLQGLTHEAGLPTVEVFPKQDCVEPGKYGNFIFLPLDGRLVPEGRTIIVEPTRWLPPVSCPWQALADRPRYDSEQIKLAAENLGVPTPTSASSAEGGATPLPKHALTDQGRSGPPADYPLPACARRMLADGVVENQRVACFRLAVHFYRLGVPFDISLAALGEWSRKNQPSNGKRLITADEIRQQTADAYRGGYRGYGCEEPMIAAYCGDRCPIQNRKQVDCNASAPSHA